jgi:hypothetical protein
MSDQDLYAFAVSLESCRLLRFVLKIQIVVEDFIEFREYSLYYGIFRNLQIYFLNNIKTYMYIRILVYSFLHIAK